MAKQPKSEADEIEKLSWYVSDIAIILIGLGQFGVIDLSTTISVSWIPLGTYLGLTAGIGLVAGVMSIFYKLVD